MARGSRERPAPALPASPGGQDGAGQPWARLHAWSPTVDGKEHAPGAQEASPEPPTDRLGSPTFLETLPAAPSCP